MSDDNSKGERPAVNERYANRRTGEMFTVISATDASVILRDGAGAWFDVPREDFAQRYALPVPGLTASGAINLAVAEVEALAADYTARADGASPAQEEIMRAFAASLRHLAARIRALPHLAAGGPL